MSAIVNRLYNIQSINQWQHERTMLHSSGIWGREPVLQYLADEVIRTGDVVVDLGAGAGYPTLRVAAMLGATGKVIGVDLSEAMVASARRHCRAGNLSFRLGNISQPLPLVDEYADVVTGFMVLHNLRRAEMRQTLTEVERILKPSGRAVFLTMHPDAFESKWDLQFLSYDLSALKRYRDAADKEDIEIPGRARNAAGGENSIATVYHSRQAVIQATHDAGLSLADEQDLWIDRKTAVEIFGAQSIRKMPTVPIYWMLVLKRAVLNDQHAADVVLDLEADVRRGSQPIQANP